MRRLLLLLLTLTLWAAPPCRAADRLVFGLDWTAEAEYGGYYQALATGIYARHGLEVEIRQGGPQTNQTQLLLAGRLDLSIASNSFIALNLVREHIPFRAVAAVFQKDPAVLIAHPGAHHDSFEELRGQPVMLGADSRTGWWEYLKAKYGYTDGQVRPYTFNLAPFLADPKAVQQGYLGSEPFSIEQQAGFKPVVLLVSDAGFEGYGSLILAGDKTIAGRPDLIQRFIDASAEGWYSFLYGDPGPGEAAIKTANPEMTDALLAYGRSAILGRGIVDGGDALTLGIGAMTDARWARFATQAAAAYPGGVDVTAAYTLQFTGRRAGMSLKP